LELGVPTPSGIPAPEMKEAANRGSLAIDHGDQESPGNVAKHPRGPKTHNQKKNGENRHNPKRDFHRCTPAHKMETPFIGVFCNITKNQCRASN
jgi:hypothetical protein